MQFTRVFEKTIDAYVKKKRHIVNMGGTSSSKTVSILQLLYLIARKKTKQISVVSETLPHLKMGAMNDFENILTADELYNQTEHNKTDHIYRVGTSEIQFFSAENPGKVTGPRRDILFLNECNHLPYPIAEAAALRTNDCIFYDFNPTAEFWIVDEILMRPASEYALIKSNYKDNALLNPNIKAEIERKAAKDPNFKKIHVDVEFGTYKGLIFEHFNFIDTFDFPVTGRRLFGVDFGFSNDPTAIVEIAFNGGELFLDEHLYRTALLNSDIVRWIKAEELQGERFVADSAEPKSIEEIRRAGIRIEPAVKGRDSVKYGIDLMKQYRINITKRSLNLVKEFRNYKWKEDKGGNTLNEPVDIWNHGIDAARYPVSVLLGKPQGEARITF